MRTSRTSAVPDLGSDKYLAAAGSGISWEPAIASRFSVFIIFNSISTPLPHPKPLEEFEWFADITKAVVSVDLCRSYATLVGIPDISTLPMVDNPNESVAQNSKL